MPMISEVSTWRVVYTLQFCIQGLNSQATSVIRGCAPWWAMKGRQDASPPKDTGRFSNQLNNCQKIAAKIWRKNGTTEKSIATLTTMTLDQLCAWTTSQEHSAQPKTVQVLLSKASGRALQRWSIASTEGTWLSRALKCDKYGSSVFFQKKQKYKKGIYMNHGWSDKSFNSIYCQVCLSFHPM